MKESYAEGLATHSGLESCGASREGSVEALTGVHAGRVLSRERSKVRDADAVGIAEGTTATHRHREMRPGPARSQTPRTYGNTSHENREVLGSPAADGAAGRVGKSKDARRR
jgi:RNA-directed DNA polymerase